MAEKRWKMIWKKGRNVRGKQSVMTVGDELRSGSKNCGRVVEKAMNVDQRDELVVILKCKERGTMTKAKKNKLVIMLEDVKRGTKKTAGIQ